ncbi:MAG: alpha/beta hydrolase [Bauldia sp.]
MARPYTPDGEPSDVDNRRLRILPFRFPRWGIFAVAVLAAAGPAAAFSIGDLISAMFTKSNPPAKTAKVATKAAPSAKPAERAPTSQPTPAPTATRDIKADPGGLTPVIDKAIAAAAQPQPDPITTAATSLPAPKTMLVAFNASPFPYQGAIPDPTPHPFLDVEESGRKGHSSPRGGTYWEDKTYNDRRSLLYLPAGFDLKKPAAIVVFFHGNQATLDRDVNQRQQVPRQLAESGLNAVLVAPQMAVDARDSSAGHFWETGFFSRFIDEAADKLAQSYGGGAASKAAFAKLPIVVVAYSGGYLPAAWSLKSGGAATSRVKGVILLDALNAETDKFADWIANHRQTFFVSAYTKATASQHTTLGTLLKQKKIAFQPSLPSSLKPGSTAFIAAGADVVHNDFVTQAWVADPLKVMLARIPGFPRSAPPPPPKAAPPLATVAKG